MAEVYGKQWGLRNQLVHIKPIFDEVSEGGIVMVRFTKNSNDPVIAEVLDSGPDAQEFKKGDKVITGKYHEWKSFPCSDGTHLIDKAFILGWVE